MQKLQAQPKDDTGVDGPSQTAVASQQKQEATEPEAAASPAAPSLVAAFEEAKQTNEKGQETNALGASESVKEGQETLKFQTPEF